ncbi:MAG TPA: DUF4111 domain-containing protein [Candidatus Pacearchaeota archaeon]|nr:DUF4111 domain-containing protein [Candidatus Pacearchaeota archaeon]
MAVKQEFTEYNDINEVLEFLSQGVKGIFGDGLVGFYLTGSLSYGDFEPGRSDIDLAAVLKVSSNSEQIEKIGKLHQAVEQKFKQWAGRIECSYIPRAMLAEVLPPKEPRPYFGAGIFYPAADYGNEWLINRHFLYQNGVTIIGPDFKTLAAPVEIKYLKEACIRDLRQEWLPKINDEKFLANSHYQSYVVLNLCRILYAIANGDAVSKKVAANWAKEKYPQFANLIQTAQAWHYGIEINRRLETAEFIRFAVTNVNESGFQIL